MPDIPNTEILKLFYRTMKGDTDGKSYSMALRGMIIPNYEEFQRFLSNYQKKNKFFLKTLKRYQLLPEHASILETTLNREFSISEFQEKPSRIFESTYGEIRVSDCMIQECLSNLNQIYISNGMYSDTIPLISSFIDKKPVIVGICDDANSVRYQEDYKVVEALKREYREKVKIYKGKQDNLSMYAISHLGDRK